MPSVFLGGSQASVANRFVYFAQFVAFLLQKLCAFCHQKNPKKLLTFSI